jgi:hypothetical protein
MTPRPILIDGKGRCRVSHPHLPPSQPRLRTRTVKPCDLLATTSGVLVVARNFMSLSGPGLPGIGHEQVGARLINGAAIRNARKALKT